MPSGLTTPLTPLTPQLGPESLAFNASRYLNGGARVCHHVVDALTFLTVYRMLGYISLMLAGNKSYKGVKSVFDMIYLRNPFCQHVFPRKCMALIWGPFLFSLLFFFLREPLHARCQLV